MTRNINGKTGYSLPCGRHTIPLAIPRSDVFNTDSSEHMLRRKTPNGTLSAGYNGSSVDASHTQKHVIVSAPDRGVTANHSPPVDVYNRHSRLKKASYAGSFAGGFAQTSTTNLSLWSHNGETASDQDAYLQSSGFHGLAPPLDSVLHQAPAPQRFHPRNGVPFVPMALQPMWPPSLGPTTSDPQTPYGPYWPNGAFEPYRPTPPRDGHFQAEFARINLNDPTDINFHQSQLARQNLVVVYPSLSRASNPTGLYGQFPSRLPYSNLPPPFRPSDISGHAQYALNGNNSSLLPGSLPPSPYEKPSMGRIESFGGQVSLPLQVHLHRSANLQYKEQALREAHKTYIELLAAKHNCQRQSDVKPMQMNGHSNTAFPSFCNSYQSINQNNGLQFPTPPVPGNPNGQEALQTENLLSSSAEPLSHGHHNGDDNSPFQYADRQKSAHAISSFPAIFATRIFSLMYEAKTQLCYLEDIAQHSDWRWVEGMLLAGCLAQGLGDTVRAVELYRRVLECDSRFVVQNLHDVRKVSNRL